MQAAWRMPERLAALAGPGIRLLWTLPPSCRSSTWNVAVSPALDWMEAIDDEGQLQEGKQYRRQ